MIGELRTLLLLMLMLCLIMWSEARATVLVMPDGALLMISYAHQTSVVFGHGQIDGLVLALVRVLLVMAMVRLMSIRVRRGVPSHNGMIHSFAHLFPVLIHMTGIMAHSFAGFNRCSLVEL